MQTQENKKQTNPALLDAEKAFHAGAFQKVENLCQTVLAENPDEIGALNMLSGACANMGRIPEAIEYLKKACALLPHNAALHANLARLYHATGNISEASLSIHNAIQADPKNREYKLFFAAMMQGKSFNSYFDGAADTIQKCLQDPHVMHQHLSTAWYSLLQIDPALSAFWSLHEHTDYDSFSSALEATSLRKYAGNALFLNGLKRLIIGNAIFEKMMTYVRRYLLEKRDSKDIEKFSSFLSALAQQCFLNEYTYSISKEEKDILPQLDNENPIHMILLGCYEPLYRQKNAENISKLLDTGNEDFHELALQQIDEPLSEQKIMENIPRLSSIKDAVSSAVRGQYEEHPYPRWRHMDIPVLNEQQKERARGKKILVAGCGTGKEAINTATIFPYADVLAIDLSLASIAYGQRKAEEMGVNNIKFIHADILELDKLDQDFDLIVSSGVLHHMDDPAKGWKKLLSRLKPGGIMKVGLYSELGRQDVIRCRDWIAEQGWKPTTENIHLFRSKIMEMPDTEPLKEISKRLDFYSLSSCRDLVFHLQEHRYTMLQLEKIFSELSLQMIGLKLFNPAFRQEYLKMFPEDPHAVNFQNWHNFETENPLTFAVMYNFWCGRKDECESGVFPDWISALGNAII